MIRSSGDSPRASGIEPRRIRARAAELLPQGRLLPDEAWNRRHRGLVILLWIHVPALVLFGVARDKDLAHCLLEGQVIALLALVAGWHGASRIVRSIAASIGLVSCSALLVHLWDGTTEGHFHFFVVVSLLILYQDWVPFGVAIGYVIVHHGVLGAVAPHEVYGDAAVTRPWLWAAVHGGFVLASSAANLVSWRANEHLLRDPLTGLASRIVLRDRLERALSRSGRSGRPLALLFLDLDDFKLVNDSLGHSAGDRLLRHVGQRLESSLDGSATAARFGGDEFAVICEELDDPQAALAVAERIQAALAKPHQVDGRDMNTSVSIGIATSTGPEQTAEGLMRDADAAMYRAKRHGRNRVEFFDAGLRESLLRQLELETDLRHAIARQELRLHYQPEIDLATGTFSGVEALIRWEHPSYGLIPPLAFIPLAEQTGLIRPIGGWVIREACRQSARWREQGLLGDITVRVNVSAAQLVDGELVDSIGRALADTGTAPRQLCLEVTESTVARDSGAAAAVVRRIRELGVQLAVDDFGTGHSSLARLRSFEFDVLKIDRAFVSGLGDDSNDAVLTGAIIAMGHALGMSVTAEGVEDESQLEQLRRLGCDAAQGYLFARPACADEITLLLRRNSAGATAVARAAGA